ncbi:trehalase-like isoform X2 [Odontomachus brunneus]|uniref:trehalase-like isoform X2 n=1 Tax=Odontomachus brunneus TaxID=486640 RepID=UPI0013F28B0B|nr:trehalase-like isoform X2 [Odontomachus brunneus]
MAVLVVLVVSFANALSDAASIGYVSGTTSGPKDLCDSFNAFMKATNNSPNSTEVDIFVQENFAMQDELENATLPDWKENPAILRLIQDPKFREWAKDLNKIWRMLARKIKSDVIVNPQRHSLIYVNNTFIIPGGRFKEFYYWDSYWIIEGLLLCDMHVTAKGMIENFLSMVERYGFVPNGGRVYYLSRSQPPLLISMVAKYYETTPNDYEFLKKNIHLLETEFKYWHNEKTVNVTKNGKTYTMAHYVVNSRGPRPESYKEDYSLAQQLPEQERGALYNNLKAAAESGWDFSYRWCVVTNKNANLSLVNVSTSNIIPVDLNAILAKNARLLAEFHDILDNPEKAQYYTKIATDYQAAIDNILWNEDEGVWLDYDVENERARNAFYPSNLTPLYTMNYNKSKKNEYAQRAVDYLKKNKIEAFFGGTPTSVNQTGEQWDFPNAWPPLQSFLVKGLHQTSTKEAMDFARELASRWLRSNYIGYDEYGKMFEKYNAIVPGSSGGGGEYNVQDGFGWTNGVVFEFLRLYPDATSSDIEYDDGNNVSR